MKRLIATLFAAGILFAGCQEPSEVILTSEEETQSDVEWIAPQDPEVPVNAPDTLAILPSDQSRFAASLVVNSVVFETEQGTYRFAFSRVFFADRTRPVLWRGRTIGYHGTNLGNGIMLNDSVMMRVLHIIRTPDTAVIAGFEYLIDLSDSYAPNGLYTWRGYGAVGTGVTIQSPAGFDVHSPRAGSIHSRDRALVLQWSEAPHVSVVISAVEASRVRPLLHIRPKTARNGVIIPPKILRLLPRNRYFILTFIQANRRELSHYSGEMLVQAAAVHNISVQIP